MNVCAREVVVGAVWAVSVPILPGITGGLVDLPPCKCLDGQHGGLRWCWSVTIRPPGWRPDPTVFDGVNLATAMEFSRCACPADAQFEVRKYSPPKSWRDDDAE